MTRLHPLRCTAIATVLLAAALAPASGAELTLAQAAAAPERTAAAADVAGTVLAAPLCRCAQPPEASAMPSAARTR